MSITPFQIVNNDGTINESEYTRCIEFLNSYINGNIKVYQKMTWDNPLEVDMTVPKDALSILVDYVTQENNRLLTPEALENFKKLFKGILERYGSTIHTYGRYLEQSANFTDGPGYTYDVLTKDETAVLSYELSERIKAYYLNDENHTILEYNDVNYSLTNTENLPTLNFPSLGFNENPLKSNVTYYPSVYKGNLCGVYSDFQRLAGQYVGSSTLFYYSECNDVLYTTGGSSYQDSRVNEIINFNYNANVYNKSKPTRGIDFSLVSTAQNAVVNPEAVNAFLSPSAVNTSVNYLSPVFFTSQNETDWYL